MASDLIYREDAKDYVRNAIASGTNPVDSLDRVPKSIFRPVVRGNWINGNVTDHVQCNCCHKDYDWVSQAQYYNFCPNCGADMRGNENADCC